MTRHFGYCDFCMMYRDFNIIEEETEYGKEYRRTHYGILPNGIGVNIRFVCMTCGNDKKNKKLKDSD